MFGGKKRNGNRGRKAHVELSSWGWASVCRLLLRVGRGGCFAGGRHFSSGADAHTRLLRAWWKCVCGWDCLGLTLGRALAVVTASPHNVNDRFEDGLEHQRFSCLRVGWA